LSRVGALWDYAPRVCGGGGGCPGGGVPLGAVLALSWWVNPEAALEKINAFTSAQSKLQILLALAI